MFALKIESFYFIMRKRWTQETFIAKCKEVHGDKYDYSKVSFTRIKDKVCIICPKHGEFWQIAQAHIKGHGCAKCYFEGIGRRTFKNSCGVKSISLIHREGENLRMLCECPICGYQYEMFASTFYAGNNRCPCTKVQNKRLYGIWVNMKTRCYNPNVSRANKYYLNKGISICNEWKDDYIAFQRWAFANGYNDNLTIDRIDSNGDYCPENCRWATMKEQCRNRSNTRWLTINGEKKTVKEWAERINKSYKYVMGVIYKKGEEHLKNIIKNYYLNTNTTNENDTRPLKPTRLLH